MDSLEQAREARTLADVVATIEAGEFYADYDQSVADLGILRDALSLPVEGVKGEPVTDDYRRGQIGEILVLELDADENSRALDQAVDKIAALYTVPLANPEAEAPLLERVAEREAFVRLCEVIGVTAGPCAYLDAEARLAQAERERDEANSSFIAQNKRLTDLQDECDHWKRLAQAERVPAVTEALNLARPHVVAAAADRISGASKALTAIDRVLQAALHPQSAAGEEGKP